MFINITIDCDTIQDLQTHLSVIKLQVRQEMKKLKLDTDDEFPDHTHISDDNCYGSHELDTYQAEEDLYSALRRLFVKGHMKSIYDKQYNSRTVNDILLLNEPES